jgi:hypothetical protein
VKRIVLFFLSVVLGSVVTAQDSTFSGGRHQVGVNANSYLFLLNEQDYEYDLNYRYSIGTRIQVRLASSLKSVFADNGETSVAFKFGSDYKFRSARKWEFYTGADAYYSYLLKREDGREWVSHGIGVFLGIQYNADEHFSISSEPSLVWLRHQFDDPESFSPIAYWSELSIINTGQILLNYRF